MQLTCLVVALLYFGLPWARERDRERTRERFIAVKWEMRSHMTRRPVSYRICFMASGKFHYFIFDSFHNRLKFNIKKSYLIFPEN